MPCAAQVDDVVFKAGTDSVVGVDMDATGISTARLYGVLEMRRQLQQEGQEQFEEVKPAFLED